VTALPYDDVMTTPATSRPAPIGTGGDPLSDAAARLLSVPVRHVYALLWRMGLIEVRA
jgi:hypothetical protein